MLAVDDQLEIAEVPCGCGAGEAVPEGRRPLTHREGASDGGGPGPRRGTTKALGSASVIEAA